MVSGYRNIGLTSFWPSFLTAINTNIVYRMSYNYTLCACVQIPTQLDNYVCSFMYVRVVYVVPIVSQRV